MTKFDTLSIFELALFHTNMEFNLIKRRLAGSLLLLWSYFTLFSGSLIVVFLLPIFFASPSAFRYIFDYVFVGPWQCAMGVSNGCYLSV